MNHPRTDAFFYIYGELPQAGVTPPPVPVTTYHVVVNGQAMGPYGLNDLSQMVIDGQFSADSLVWKNGMTRWEMAAIGVMGAFVSKMISNAQETAEEKKRKRKQEEKRKNTPCNFEDGISEEQFEIIVKRACRHIKRLTDFKINGPVVYGKVRAISGISEWSFQVDFNDYGHITGKYWLSLGNNDSGIPKQYDNSLNNL